MGRIKDELTPPPSSPDPMPLLLKLDPAEKNISELASLSSPKFSKFSNMPMFNSMSSRSAFKRSPWLGLTIGPPRSSARPIEKEVELPDHDDENEREGDGTRPELELEPEVSVLCRLLFLSGDCDFCGDIASVDVGDGKEGGCSDLPVLPPLLFLRGIT